MPWTGKEFKDRHAHNLTDGQANKAAKMANAMLKHGVPEGEAIATAIKNSKKSYADHVYGGKK